MTRREIALAEFYDCKITLDTLGQLAAENYSDEAICKAMDRGWITEEFAEKLMENGTQEG